MTQIEIIFPEGKVQGDLTRHHLMQSIQLLKRILREQLQQDYLAFRQQAEALGIPLETLSGAAPDAAAPSPPVFVHPHNPTLVWNGRGRRPNWVREFFPPTANTVTGTHPAQDGNGGTATGEASAAATPSQETVPAETPTDHSPDAPPENTVETETRAEAPAEPAAESSSEGTSPDTDAGTSTSPDAETSTGEEPAEETSPSPAPEHTTSEADTTSDDTSLSADTPSTGTSATADAPAESSRRTVSRQRGSRADSSARS